MSFLKNIFSKNKNSVEVLSPAKGSLVPLEKVEDEAFSSGALGKGVAIEPEDSQIKSPCVGEVLTSFPTGHAIGLKAENGAEILIHIGMDTVSLDGEGFQLHVKEGDQLKPGDLLVTVDLDLIKDRDLSTITPIVVTNHAEYTISQALEADKVNHGEVLFSIEDK